MYTTRFPSASSNLRDRACQEHKGTRFVNVQLFLYHKAGKENRSFWFRTEPGRLRQAAITHHLTTLCFPATLSTFPVSCDRHGGDMIGRTIAHYKILEKLGACKN